MHHRIGIRPTDGETLSYRCDDASKNSQSREEFGVITLNCGKLTFLRREIKTSVMKTGGQASLL